MLRDLFSLFPACAGVILLTDNSPNELLAFPRMCGGDPMLSNLVANGLNFSPHVRG